MTGQVNVCLGGGGGGGMVLLCGCSLSTLRFWHVHMITLV